MDTPQEYGDQAAVYATNDGSATFKARYHSVWYTIEPGETKMVPWHAMRLWHGNPFAEDIDRKRRYRTDEWERVRAKWGVYEHDDQLHRIPAITYTDLQTGERWFTVADDPEGEKRPSAVGSETGERNLLAMVQKMSAELEALKADKGAPSSDGATGITAALYDQDTDEEVPGPEVSPRPKPKAAVGHDAPPE